MLFDTHAHPYITFKKSPEDILENFLKWEENRMISIACDFESSIKSIELAKKYPTLKASIGYHPCDIPLFDPVEGIIKKLEDLYWENSQYIVAIGEIGLDYYWLKDISEKNKFSPEKIKDIQKQYFIAQISLAKRLKLPFIIHSRESNEEVLEILIREEAQNYVFHCFSWNWDFTQRVLLQNPSALFGLWWVLTFKKSWELQEVAKNLPLENILIETDAPFLTPEPLRGKEENESLYVKYVLKKLQELRWEDPDSVERIVYENSNTFFRIPKNIAP